MNKLILKSILGLAILHFAGCASYHPQAVDIPLIKEKGDMRINAGASVYHDLSNSTFMGLHGTFSGGITDFLAVQTYLNLDGLLGCHWQGALGIFKGLENNVVMELYGGGGFCRGLFDNEEEKMNQYQFVFSQFNIGKTNVGNSNLDFGLGLKGAFLNNRENYHIELIDTYKVHKKYCWTIEPSAFLRFGGNRAKFNTMINYLWTDNVAKSYYFPLGISFGVNFKLGKKGVT
ncbi:MAG: hypothetical protein FWH18_00925 [Marinilabiliaceae bacterium]|nr:hypothetical protein [Marinilabiliaceae bacterium]